MATPFVVTGRDLEHVLQQINQKFDDLNARVDKLEHKLKEKEPKRGRPAKDAA